MLANHLRFGARSKLTPKCLPECSVARENEFTKGGRERIRAPMADGGTLPVDRRGVPAPIRRAKLLISLAVEGHPCSAPIHTSPNFLDRTADAMHPSLTATSSASRRIWLD